MKKNKNIINNKAFTQIDLVISISIIVIFSGLIIKIFNNIYIDFLEIQKGSNAIGYATMILEKVDEKSFEVVNDANFLNKLKIELHIPDNYNIIMNTKIIYNNLVTRVDLKVNYEVNNQIRTIKISKLKVKEIKLNE